GPRFTTDVAQPTRVEGDQHVGSVMRVRRSGFTGREDGPNDADSWILELHVLTCDRTREGPTHLIPGTQELNRHHVDRFPSHVRASVRIRGEVRLEPDVPWLVRWFVIRRTSGLL